MTDWKSMAACRGVEPDLFFPFDPGRDVGKEAKEICDGCKVRQICLEFALQNGEKYGVWGGTSERTRKRMRTQRARNAGYNP